MGRSQDMENWMVTLVTSIHSFYLSHQILLLIQIPYLFLTRTRLSDVLHTRHALISSLLLSELCITHSAGNN